MLRANMALADSTDESADDMTAADTAPSPMNVTHDGHRYCITIGRIIFSSSGVIGIRCRGRSVLVQSVQIHGARRTPLHYINGMYLPSGWLSSRVVSVLDSGAEGTGFKSQSRRCRVTVLGKLFTPIVPLFTKQQNW